MQTHIATSTLESEPKPAAGSAVRTCPHTSTFLEAILACLACLSLSGGDSTKLFVFQHDRNLCDNTLHQQHHAMKCTGNGIRLCDFSFNAKTKSPCQADPTPQLQRCSFWPILEAQPHISHAHPQRHICTRCTRRIPQHPRNISSLQETCLYSNIMR